MLLRSWNIFFSSRRRHTRYWRDWSSDVCSSDLVATRAAGLAGELARIAIGASDVAPSSRDKRFADPAWTQNPMLRRVVQAYLAAGETVEGLVQDVPLEWRERMEKGRGGEEGGYRVVADHLKKNKKRNKQ